MRSLSVRLLLLGLGELAGFAALSRLDHPASQAPEAILILLLTSVFYLISVPIAHNREWLLIAAFAVLFRLTAWQVTPEFSDDLYRYQWEARLQAAGGNPYQVRPSDPAWRFLQDENFSRIPAREFKAGYGPLWELLGRFISDPKLFRMAAALGDLLVMIMLFFWHRERWVIYAWCPLPLLEFWVSGHFDSLLLALLVGAVIAFQNARAWTGWSLWTLAGLVKWWPILLFPIIWNRERSAKFLIAIPVAFPLVLLYWGPFSENFQFVTGFLGGWKNNDSLFGIISALAGTAEAAKWSVLGLLVVTAVVLAWLGRPLPLSILLFVVAMLLVSANVHPWYLTWIVPFLVLYPWAPLLLWVALAPLSYVVLIEYSALGIWNGSTSWRWGIYGPVFGFATIAFLLQIWRNGRYATRPESPTPPLSQQQRDDLRAGSTAD